MRPIKFRAWNVATKTIIDLKKITPLALNMDTDGLFIPFSDGIILMQFTGLHDKNGKEIYEGDIVKRTKTDEGMPIVWSEKHANFEFEEPTSFVFCERLAKSFYEIIGNIYENPELLEQL